MRLSQIYGRLFQAVAYPLILAPTRSQATRNARRIRKQQRWPLAKIQAYQLDRLQEIIRLAEAESPFYRQRWADAGVSSRDIVTLDDLRRFPITTKSELEANFPDGLAIRSRRNEDWQYVGTRGTTRRVMVIHDFERRDLERAAGMVALTDDSPFSYGARELSIPPDACSVHCGLESDSAESVGKQLVSMATGKVPWNRESMSDLRGLVMNNWIRAQTILPPLPLDGSDAELQQCVAEIRKQKPIQLTALPEYLRALAQYILRTGDRPPAVAVLRPMGANFPRSWKLEVETAFGGKLREHYGSREMGPMAFDCQQANGLHVLSSQHLIEVERDGQPVADGEVGRVLVTDLNNLAMPIVRYDIGDLARIDHSPCPCGRQTPRLFMEGRIQDAMVLDSGRILTAEAIANYFASEPCIEDFELTESQSGKWTLRVVPASGEWIDQDGLASRFLAWCGEDRRLSIRETQAIRPEESGKYRHSKSRSFERLSQPVSPIQ